jgi:PAS domain S-box-containing protein
MIPVTADFPTGPPLAEIVHASRDEIIARWTARVRRELGDELPEPELVDSVPALLERLEDAIRGTGPASPRAARAQGVAETAARHGAQRAAIGVDLDRVVREHALLADVILDVVQEHGLVPSVGEVRALMRVVSMTVAEAVTEHVAETDRVARESSDRLRAIADHAPAAIFVRDARGRFAFVNAMCAELLGRRREEILGRTYDDVLSPELVAYFRPIEERVERGETVELEGRFPTARGERVVHVVKFPLPGEPGAICVIGLDVTERTQAERRLQQAHEFEQQLIGIVSHDLRTPLGTIVLGAKALLARGDLQERQASGVARLLAAAEQASRMIRDLLDLARARVGPGIPIQPRTVDLRAVLARALEDYRATYPDREIRLAAEGDLAGCWDADRLVQALGNLVTNAVKYGAPGSEIAVALEGTPDAVRLSVHSMGEPIPAAVLPTLFHPGARHAADPADGGLGLGLFIVERIAAAHGGTVSVSSTREDGTTFTLTLPRRGA